MESEVVTGERVQALAEAILVPDAIALRNPDAEQFAERAVRFHEHGNIDDDDIRRISRARSLFVYTHALSLFQEHVWPRLTGSGYVLITHNSDAEIGPEQVAWIDGAGEKLGGWLAQNVTVEHTKLTPVPIGLANARWPHGDVAALASIGPVERTELMHARFDLSTHPDRQRAWEAVRAAFPGAGMQSRRPFSEYLSDLARHRFCAVPRGNGVDTHRFWECQYLGVVPVVERSAHTDVWARRGLPMVALEDWSELSRERLEAEPADPDRAGSPLLSLSYYATRVPQ